MWAVFQRLKGLLNTALADGSRRPQPFIRQQHLVGTIGTNHGGLRNVSARSTPPKNVSDARCPILSPQFLDFIFPCRRPLLIVNMGGEMVYILAQRLQAQSVPLDKSKRVLQDVVRTMYNKMFIDELFRPQDIYSMASTRQIFDRLAHSSIMRLNESSMDKLFDLMTMGFKYQMLACSYPQELLYVTLNHLYQLRQKVEEAEPVAALIDDVIARTNEKYAPMTPFEFAGLKQTLCRFFADKRVKVSLFLQDHIQKNDGTIVLTYSGSLPPGTDFPGKIEYLDTSARSIGTDSFDFPASETIQDDRQGQPIDPRRQLACMLGQNLYSKEKVAMPPQQQAAAEDAARAAQAAPVKRPQVDSVEAANAILASESHARQDLNLLADLIGHGVSQSDNFKLNLFPETSMPSGAGGVGGIATTQVITIDGGGRANIKANADLLGIGREFDGLGGPGIMGGGGGAEDPDDLLSMMDQAGDDY